jgi:hypothetical protein
MENEMKKFIFNIFLHVSFSRPWAGLFMLLGETVSWSKVWIIAGHGMFSDVNKLYLNSIFSSNFEIFQANSQTIIHTKANNS